MPRLLLRCTSTQHLIAAASHTLVVQGLPSRLLLDDMAAAEHVELVLANSLKVCCCHAALLLAHDWTLPCNATLAKHADFMLVTEGNAGDLLTAVEKERLIKKRTYRCTLSGLGYAQRHHCCTCRGSAASAKHMLTRNVCLLMGTQNLLMLHASLRLSHRSSSMVTLDRQPRDLT